LFVLASRNEEDTNEGGAKQGEKAFGPTSKEGGAEGHWQEGLQGEALKEEKITAMAQPALTKTHIRWSEDGDTCVKNTVQVESGPLRISDVRARDVDAKTTFDSSVDMLNSHVDMLNSHVAVEHVYRAARPIAESAAKF
jgi:hypothetical protein